MSALCVGRYLGFCESFGSVPYNTSENIISKLYQKGQETLNGQRRRESEKEQRGHQGQRRRRKGAEEEVLQELDQMSTTLLRTRAGAGLS